MERAIFALLPGALWGPGTGSLCPRTWQTLEDSIKPRVKGSLKMAEGRDCLCREKHTGIGDAVFK